MKLIFLILNGNELSLRELTIYLNESIYDLAPLIHHYWKSGYLTRHKNDERRFEYTLSEKGYKQLEWLENGGAEEYIQKYKQEFEIYY